MYVVSLSLWTTTEQHSQYSSQFIPASSYSWIATVAAYIFLLLMLPRVLPLKYIRIHTFINLLIFAFLYVYLPSKSFNLSIKKSECHPQGYKKINTYSFSSRACFFFSTFYNACKWNMDYYRLILLIEVSKHLDRPLILLICAVLSCNWFVSVQ